MCAKETTGLESRSASRIVTPSPPDAFSSYDRPDRATRLAMGHRRRGGLVAHGTAAAARGLDAASRSSGAAGHGTGCRPCLDRRVAPLHRRPRCRAGACEPVSAGGTPANGRHIPDSPSSPAVGPAAWRARDSGRAPPALGSRGSSRHGGGHQASESVLGLFCRIACWAVPPRDPQAPKERPVDLAEVLRILALGRLHDRLTTSSDVPASRIRNSRPGKRAARLCDTAACSSEVIGRGNRRTNRSSGRAVWTFTSGSGAMPAPASAPRSPRRVIVIVRCLPERQKPASAREGKMPASPISADESTYSAVRRFQSTPLCGAVQPAGS